MSSSLKKMSFSKSDVAFVMKENINSISVYIPTLMSEIDMGNTIWNKNETISTSMIKNSNIQINFDKSIKIKNYLDIEPKNISNIAPPKVNIGEKINIKFLDNDIKKCVYTHEDVDEEVRTSDRYHISIKDKEKVSDSDSTYDFIMDSDTQIIQIKMGQGRGEKEELMIELSGNGYINLKGDTKISGNLFINDINLIEYTEKIKGEYSQRLLEIEQDYQLKINNLRNELITLINSK